MKNHPRKHGASVGRRHDARLEEGRIFRLFSFEREHLAPNVVARQENEGTPRDEIHGDGNALRPAMLHAEHGAVRSRQNTRQRSLAGVGQLAEISAASPPRVSASSQAARSRSSGSWAPAWGIDDDVRRKKASRNESAWAR